jgi:YVTN family beta-propeller protein
MAYVANSGGNPGTVSVIDTSTNTVVATVDVGHSPFALGNFVGALPGCLGGTPPLRRTPAPRPRRTPVPRP